MKIYKYFSIALFILGLSYCFLNNTHELFNYLVFSISIGNGVVYLLITAYKELKNI